MRTPNMNASTGKNGICPISPAMMAVDAGEH